MILNFSIYQPFNKKPTRFKERILSNEKCHTLREDKSNRWYRGAAIHFCTGARTKAYDNFKNGKCQGTQEIVIQKCSMLRGIPLTRKKYRYEINEFFYEIIVDNRKMTTDMIDKLAKNDGFDSTEDFFTWFKDGFEGKIIHWTPIRY